MGRDPLPVDEVPAVDLPNHKMGPVGLAEACGKGLHPEAELVVEHRAHVVRGGVPAKAQGDLHQPVFPEHRAHPQLMAAQGNLVEGETAEFAPGDGAKVIVRLESPPGLGPGLAQLEGIDPSDLRGGPYGNRGQGHD